MDCTTELESAIRLLKYAKQDLCEVLPLMQTLNYVSHNDYLNGKEKIKIVEFDEEFMQRLECGESLAFKGCGNEKLVFCTEDATYEVKEGETSNTLLLCPELLYIEDINVLDTTKRTMKMQTVYGLYHNYLELRPTFPRLNKLRKILTPTAYAGPETEVDSINRGHYLCELIENIQCSREELLKGLEDLSACCIRGKWRILSQKYESEVLSLIISLMEEHNSSVIHKSETRIALKSQVPDFIIDHILQCFARAQENDNIFVLKEEKVCRCFAETLLTAAGGTFVLNEFIKSWKACLPVGLTINLKYLHGLALIEKGKSDEEVISLLPEYNLPENISERFRLLFKRKEKWTYDEITPYIVKLTTKTMNVNSMLTKFSRVCTVNGTRLFSARHAY